MLNFGSCPIEHVKLRRKWMLLQAEQMHKMTSILLKMAKNWRILTGINFICISLDSNDDSVMRLVNVFCFSFHSAPTAKIYPRELIASSRGVRINLQKVPLFGHFRQRWWYINWAADIGQDIIDTAHSQFSWYSFQNTYQLWKVNWI